ncbi:uncharacterized protein LOC111197366 isoform X4 [Astyanax mexicanus]|uniref:uncharacterized protein LOC111197366 isoform X4 n=1 Tax=Astyanax mexicanus TaxID=7994 RepID=UPI0020CAD549|nr:uncharacterized protein LOC111197366 isoform X4 [Astyanax mexicanus]
MARAGIIFLILYEICSAETVGNTEPSVVSVKVGKSVTLNCTSALIDKSKVAYWFKYRLEHKPQEVGFKLKDKQHELQNPFKDSKSGFELKEVGSGLSLSIKEVQKEDEGMYFCGSISEKSVNFSTGTFLAVSDPSNISVLQTPALQSVPPGEAVNLQCTVLSEIRSAELRVFWIRSAAGSSFPEIIFTHHNSSSSSNSSRQCEISSPKHSSVYNFSTNIPNNHHAATYYCAVETCGRIIVGNGTTVEINKGNSCTTGVLVVALGVFSGVCVVVICAQAIIILKLKRTGPCAGKLQPGAVVENAFSQDQNADSLNYASVQFKEKKPKREERRRREEPEELVYSQVRSTTHRPKH